LAPDLKLVDQRLGLLEELGDDRIGEEMAGLAEVETALPDLGPVGLQLLVGEQAAHNVLPQVHVREDLVRVPQDLLTFGQRHRGSLVRVPGFWVIFRHCWLTL
jgi:hypothetical protein